MKNCRENGMQMTEAHATELREAWISAFPEMDEHFKAKPINMNVEFKGQLGFVPPKNMPATSSDEEDDEEEEGPPDFSKDLYRAEITNGMIRNNCSYNSYLNIFFQGLASYGGKCGLWNLIMSGFAERLCDFIHDEIVYWLYPEELDTLIPVVEDCMIRGMRVATPHVRVGVETCCMLHWDKHAEEFVNLKKDENGKYIIPEPPYVREVLGLP